MTEKKKVKVEGGLQSTHSPISFINLTEIIEPYAQAAIALDPDTKQLKYFLIEPTLPEEEKNALTRVKELLMEELDMSLKALGSPESAREYLKDKVAHIVKKHKIRIPQERLDVLMYYVMRDFIGLGSVGSIMKDRLIEDITCDGVGIPLYVYHRQYGYLPTNVVFRSAEELDSFVLRLAYRSGRHISVMQPIVDSVLPDESRVHITYSTEVSKKGSSFTIRKFRADPLTITDLISFNSITPDIAAYLWLAIENNMSIVVAGATATGKTTLLNCLAMFIKPEYKVITVEDTAELNIPHENWLSLVTRTGWVETAEITLFDLLKSALRQRPDYIIVGEVRGGEAYTLFQAIATGHGGLCSIHADSASSAIRRFESEPMNIPRTLITLVDALVVLVKVKVGELPVRRVEACCEIVDLDPRTKDLLTNDAYRWSPKSKGYIAGRRHLMEKILKEKDYTPEALREEMERRKVILEWMERKGIRNYHDVGGVIREYYRYPMEVYRKAKIDLSLPV